MGSINMWVHFTVVTDKCIYAFIWMQRKMEKRLIVKRFGSQKVLMKRKNVKENEFLMFGLSWKTWNKIKYN